jgi:hypothetical protein
MPAANLDRLRRHRPKLEKLGEIADAARGVAREIRACFPVEGEPWVYEDAPDEAGVEVRPMNALWRLDRALYPNRPPSRSPKRRSLAAYAQLMGKDRAGLGDFFRFVYAVMNCHHRVVKHYQAGRWVAGDGAPGNPWPWNWSDLPPIPPRLVAALDKAGAGLEGEVSKALTATRAAPGDRQEQAVPPPCAPPAVLWYHGGLSYSADGERPKKVSKQQHNVLTAFLDSKQALDTRSLKNLGVANPTKVVGQLAKKFPGTVDTPDRKRDGYFIRVRPLFKKG